MNLDSLSFTLSQIGYLVGSLNKRNGKQALQRLAKLVSLHGLEADRHLLQCLFSSVDFSDTSSKLGPAALQQAPHNQILNEHCATVINRAVLVSSICSGVSVVTADTLDVSGNFKGLHVGTQIFQQLCKCLRLTPVQEVVFALAFRHSDEEELVRVAREHLRIIVPALVQSYIDTEGSSRQHEGGLHDTAPEIAHLILGAILASPKDVGLTNDLYRSFLSSLQRDFPEDLVPVVLAPLIYPDRCELAVLPEMSSEGPGISGGMLDTTNLYDLVSDIGYTFTATVDECRANLLKLVSGRDLNEGVVARTLSFMCRTCSSNLDDAFKDARGANTGWNIENFVQALKEVAPNLSWSVVVLELDHPEFVIKDRQSLMLLISALRIGLQTLGFHSDTFPVDNLYRRWSNVEGQFSLIQQVLKNPDVFSFADHAFHSVPVDVLKTPPEQDSKELANWRNVNLVELLLALSECGFYAQVQELFKVPVQLCPDVLILTLTHIQGSITILRQELISNLIPTFLGNHPNSAIILHHAWNSMTLNVKHIIMHSMAEWYIRGDCDQTRLSRILDVAQDLKALSLLLNAQSYPFIIDLACLASRREYLKLEKWLTDKIREHGESFVTACLKFLQRRCPQLFGKADDLSKGHGLPKETVSTILMCLQSVASSMSAECQEAILSIANQGSYMFKMNQAPPPPQQTASSLLRSHRAALEGPFNPSTISGAIYNPTVDSIAGLNSTLASITLNPSSTPFTIQGGLGPLVSSPGSPSRILGVGPSNSPFPGAMIPPVQHQGPVGTAAAAGSLIPGVNTIGNLSRVEDKLRMPDLFPEISPNISKEIEDEANSFFQRIYNLPPHPTLSIDEVLEMLKKFQESHLQKERELFKCMLRNLFEEYKFFPQYPDKELYITAQLFGGIIEHGLVSNVRLGVALCCVFDALNKSKTSKMYNFGIIALDRFKSVLKVYSQFCKRVKSIAHFSEFPSHLMEYIEYGLLSMEPPNKPQGTVLPASLSSMLSSTGSSSLAQSSNMATGRGAVGSGSTVTSTGGNIGKTLNTSSNANTPSRPSIANATNIDTLLVATEKEEKVISPPETLQDKTAFIFNNLSQLNLQSKCEELRELVSDEYWPWISQYLVMKRASIELNFHGLYSNFLDMLKVNEVNRMVTRETFRNIKVLLRSDKGIANFSDRSLLKNLGHWLGILTLQRNKPILQIDIDLKALLVEAYHKGQQELLYVVPFVAKVLESCAKSKVFKPPNPWTMGIMNVLGELHVEPDLKLNLKFEIEVLCKTLGLEVGSLKPIVYLKDPERVRRLEYQLSQPAKKDANMGMVQQQNQQQQQTLVHGGALNSNLNEPDIVGQVGATSPPVSQINSSTTPTSSLTTVPEPRFNYADIQIAGSQALQTHLIISPNIVLFSNLPNLKQLVRTAVERAVQEWIAPVVDRAIKISVTTCEHIIRKDFSLDAEEMRIRNSAHAMARYLTAGMVMITCRDQLLGSINTHLKNLLQSAAPTATSQQKEMIEQAANVIAQDNMELGCAFIQKTAIEKVIPEIDKRLAAEYELRKLARQEGRRYWDSIALAFQTERMPEPIRTKLSVITTTQYAVYDEFARNIPGFQPLSEREVALFSYKPSMDSQAVAAASATIVPTAHPIVNAGTFQSVGNLIANEDVIAVYEKLASEVENFVQGTQTHQNMAAMHSNLHVLHECLMLAIRTRDVLATGPTIIQKCVESLQDQQTAHITNENEHIVMRYKEIFVRVLKSLQDPRAFGAQWTNKQVTRLLIDTREEYRYNLEAIETLIRAGLVNMPQFDAALAQMLDNGQNCLAVSFATHLMQLLLVDDRSNQCVTELDFPNTIDVLSKVSLVRVVPEGLNNLLELLRQGHEQSVFFGDRAPAGPSVHIHNGILQVRSLNYEDPPGLVEKTDFLLRDWISIYHSQPSGRDSTKAFSMFVHQMNVHGILKTDDLITRFFRLSTQLCVETVYRNMTEAPNNNMNMAQMRSKCYHTLDPFVRLIALLVKHSGDLANTSTKIHLLNKVLGIVAGCLLQDHEQRNLEFQQLPYQRIFVMLYLELCSPEPVLESINFQVLTAYCHTLHILRPAKAPGFSYAWLELISHRVFIGRMLALTPQQKGWNMYAQLLVDLFKYLAPFLRNAELAKPVTMLYKGSLRVLLVLLHDFPEFLCDFHYGFCDVIPPNCVQLRNLILSAFPRNMRLPDPFTPNLKVDVLQEITYAPRIVTNFAALVTPTQFKKDLDLYLKNRTPVTFLSEIRGHLQVSSEPGMRYNIPLMNALVMYVGTQAISSIRSKGLAPNMSTIAHSAHMDIFQNMAVDLDTEGRYLFLNAVANQLRYPNSHTHYFSCTLLYLFAEANTEAIQEQITRVLLERLIVNRPHPWGLLITFIELIKNPSYKFWNHEFVHCAPEIEKLFESVARSCMVQKTPVQSQEGGGRGGDGGGGDLTE